MDTRTIITTLAEDWGLSIKDLARSIGWSPQKLYNKLARGTLRVDELMLLLKANGLGIKLMESDGDTGRATPGRGPRTRAMVDGVVYDTDKAEAIAGTFHKDMSAPNATDVELYRDKGGRYFVVEYQMNGGLSKIRSVPEAVAIAFAEKYGE